jgi:hypothetical protein
MGTRFYEIGIDRGVVYIGTDPGVAWSGLISVVENPSGGDPDPYYMDGVKYLNVPSSEEYEATIQAFTYPDAFSVCDGTVISNAGLFVTHQPRKSFGLSYRTKIGNDLGGPDFAFKLHIVYNALAAPSQRTYQTFGESLEVAEFSWDITTQPPTMPGYKPTAHIVVDSRHTNPTTIAAIEDILYGSSSGPARLPTLAELVTIFEDTTILDVTDNGDGTFTVTGPDTAILMIDETTFQITWPSAIYIDDDSYTISSL